MSKWLLSAKQHLAAAVLWVVFLPMAGGSACFAGYYCALFGGVLFAAQGAWPAAVFGFTITGSLLLVCVICRLMEVSAQDGAACGSSNTQ